MAPTSTATEEQADARPLVTRAIYVGSGGTLAVRLLSGQTVTFAGVSAGSILPPRADRVLATGTTAGSIVGLV